MVECNHDATPGGGDAGAQFITGEQADLILDRLTVGLIKGDIEIFFLESLADALVAIAARINSRQDVMVMRPVQFDRNKGKAPC